VGVGGRRDKKIEVVSCDDGEEEEDDDDELLVVREARNNYRPWKIPGGLAELGEHLDEAAIREVFYSSREYLGLYDFIRAASDFLRCHSPSRRSAPPGRGDGRRGWASYPGGKE
jgi:hypothetical protein